MKRTQNRIPKFNKKDNLCNICQQQTILSEDHVPPKACPSPKDVVVNKLLYQMTDDRSFHPRFSQTGVTYRTICRTCNSLLGQYDRALVKFSEKIQSFVESKLTLPNTFDLECCPNAIMRSVLGHLLAAKTEADQVVIDNLTRPFILDSSLPIHDDIHIFYWIYPYEKTVILRDFMMPSVRGVLENSTLFNMLKFYPTAFLVAYKLPSYEGLQSLYQFNKILVDDIANVEINLRSIQRSSWPEECCGLENYLVLGRSANDSAYAIPKARRVKLFKDSPYRDFKN